jgi:membrane protein implicated in regulation of membrane protease activity
MALLHDLFVNHAFWAWMASGAVLLAIELATGTGYLLWPAAVAAVVGFATLVSPPNLPVDALAFALLTIVATIIGRRFFPSPFQHKGADINDRGGRLIGKMGEIVGAFDAGRGRVFVDGSEWAAEMADDATPAAVGARVEVVEMLGAARLKVKAA